MDDSGYPYDLGNHHEILHFPDLSRGPKRIGAGMDGSSESKFREALEKGMCLADFSGREMCTRWCPPSDVNVGL